MIGIGVLVICLTVVLGQDLDNVTIEFPGLVKNLEVYSGDALGRVWPEVKGMLGAGCQAHLDAYLNGLKTGTKWALKMEDASGRYSTGWYWGNSYWLGSKTLCDNIAPDLQREVINGSDVIYDNGRVRRDARASLVSTTPSPSSWLEYDPNRALEGETSLPFPVAFFSLRLRLNVSTTIWSEGNRSITVGSCLPRSCSEQDVRSIFTHLPSRPVVINLRSPHQRYLPQDDATFRILAGATIAIVILLAAGTTYDLYLREDRKHLRRNVTPNGTPYNLASHVKLDINLPELKIHNGKSAMYVVNNNNQGSEESIGESSTVSEDVNNPDVTKILSDMLLSFSLRTNWRQICDKSIGSDTVAVVHGLRAISMAWVILGHTCIIAFKYSDNMDYRKLVEKQFLFQTVANGAFSVDTFFFISGLLVSFLYFRTNAKGKLDPLTRGSKGFTAGCLHFIGLLGYRFARLTAPYLYVLGIVEVSMKWFHYNSLFEPPTLDHINCPQYWWRNVLYINTLFPVEQMCMLWSWYLSDDTQFYVVGAIILILANTHFKTACGLSVILLISSWGTTGYIAFSNNHTARTDDPLALFDKIYDKPWTRLGPYMIGMAAGWVLFKCNGKPRISWAWASIGWIACASILLALVFGLYEASPSPVAAAAHGALCHSIWAVALAWLVLACAAGRGGLVTKLLSAPALYPFSRVTYCAYLVHPVLIRGLAMQLDAPLHLDAGAMAVMFLGQVAVSYGLSFLISLAVEAPVVTMLKILTQFKVKK